MSSRFQAYALIVIAVLLALLPLAGSRYAVELATQIMIFALFALSLNLLIGYLGSVSFGHAAFFAIGGYACAYLQTRIGLPLVVSMAGAVVITALAATVIGYFCVRLNEIYFAMLTLAFSMLVWAIAIKWKPVTGGDDGFVGVAVPEMLTSPTSFFFFTLAVSAGCVVLLWFITNSTMGKTFVAIRENQTRASFLGVNVRLVRLSAFVIAGSFAGVAGSLMALYLRGMYPESAFWTQSGQVLIMVLLGGMHSFVGPVLGAAALYLLEVTINQYTEYWQIVLGAILLAIVLAAPEGIYGIIRNFISRTRRSDHGDA
ncbi:MAG: branched-chain amino acid ABC transporter permease [Notoacmeibacter sp.]|nr:branched-chain amino acid ABC transporter permease [Notoacmeibacter sp.]